MPTMWIRTYGLEHVWKLRKKVSFENQKLTVYREPIHNNWFILDFPSTDVIRRIYLSNSFRSSNNSFKHSLTSNLNSNYYNDLNILFDSKYYIYKKIVNNTMESDNEKMLCIQRKLKNNKKNKNYTVKTNFECVDNSRNKWYFKQNNEFLNIISAFDDKCLLYENNKLTIGKWNNDYKDFIIKNEKLCSKINTNNCLDEYEIIAVPLECEEYQNLDCQIEIIKHGYKCCSESVEIDHTDEIGTWDMKMGNYVVFHLTL